MYFTEKIEIKFQLGVAEMKGISHVWQNEIHNIILGQDFLQNLFSVTLTDSKPIFNYGHPDVHVLFDWMDVHFEYHYYRDKTTKAIARIHNNIVIQLVKPQ